mmetsp:Transcript_128426/g.240274  ORF Transcript_128426/g.240274 Transcript_128426/m.240274 type:complete len:94 (+) Transcript_128426:452-733(+)
MVLSGQHLNENALGSLASLRAPASTARAACQNVFAHPDSRNWRAPAPCFSNAFYKANLNLALCIRPETVTVLELSQVTDKGRLVDKWHDSFNL